MQTHYGLSNKQSGLTQTTKHSLFLRMFCSLFLSLAFLSSPAVYAAFPTSVDNTATVNPPTGVTDPDDTNNTAVDTNNLLVGSVSGTVLDDQGNPLVGVTLTLDDGDPGTVDPIATTQADGSYIFNDVADGEYLVVETDPAGYESVSDSQSADGDTTPNTNTNDNSIPVTVTNAENDANNNFVDILPAPQLTTLKTITTPAAVRYKTPVT